MWVARPVTPVTLHFDAPAVCFPGSPPELSSSGYVQESTHSEDSLPQSHVATGVLGPQPGPPRGAPCWVSDSWGGLWEAYGRRGTVFIFIPYDNILGQWFSGPSARS